MWHEGSGFRGLALSFLEAIFQGISKIYRNYAAKIQQKLLSATLQ